jgi:CheY-like chemotaxis protein
MPNQPTTLLIVDDEPSIRESLTQVLTELGYSVRSADNGFSALSEIVREAPELLLSDLNMPGMSGFELLSVVRHSFPAIRTIAISGSFHGDEVPSGVAADAFLQKGSSIIALLRIIETLSPIERHTPSVFPFSQSLQPQLLKSATERVNDASYRRNEYAFARAN